MKKEIITSIIIFSLMGCGYGMYYTKAITPIPSDVTQLNVMEVKDVKVVTKYGKGSGRADYVKSILLSQLLSSERFSVDGKAQHHLIVSIDGYRAGYRKYIALSAQLIDASADKLIWSAAISGVSKKYIDEVIKNVVCELVNEMSKLN